MRSLLFLEHCGSLFVSENRALKLAEIGRLVRRNLDLADDVFALVVELVALCGDGGVIAGKTRVNVDGVWGLVDHVSIRQRDVKTITPEPSGTEIDWHRAGLVVKGQCMRSDNAWADQKQRSGLVCVLSCSELVVNLKGF